MQEAIIWLKHFARKCDAEAQRQHIDQRAIHERLGARMQTAVRGQIRGKINDAHGHISGWQTKYIGSDGGYVAIRATDISSGSNSPGAITNYLENGHAIRRPNWGNPRYRRRVNVLYVDGRGFYAAVRPSLPRMLQSEVDRWGREVADRLGGR